MLLCFELRDLLAWGLVALNAQPLAKGHTHGAGGGAPTVATAHPSEHWRPRPHDQARTGQSDRRPNAGRIVHRRRPIAQEEAR